MRFKSQLFLCFFFAFTFSGFAETGPRKPPIEFHIQVGEVRRLGHMPAKADGVVLESLTPQVLEVFQNGFYVGLAPGEGRIRMLLRGKEMSQWVFNVQPFRAQLVDPASLEQYPDNRKFVINGRKCFGSGLNGQRASDLDERIFTKSNRIINPNPLRADKPLDWELRPETEVYDGAGVLMGTVPATLDVTGRRLPVSMFNFGASKVLHGRMCVYAFSVSIKPSDAVFKLFNAEEKKKAKVSTSAWLPLDSVVEKERLLERIGLGKSRLPALPLESTGVRVTGGNPKMYETPQGELSIVRKVVENGPVPSHYLRRPSGTINLIYSVPGFGLGGQGVDSFLLTDGLEFFPAKGAKVFEQPTYYPVKHPQTGKISPQTMTFIYGAIKAPGCEPVYGWIAKEALEVNASVSQ